jgi:uncharacterized membrane protein YhaH (DUF805 family)
MKCPSCSNENVENSRFCGECGKSLSASTVVGIGVELAELPMVDFGTAIKLGFQRYFDFKARSTRAEYWWWSLFTIGVFFIALFIDGMTGTYNEDIGYGVLSGLFSLAIFIPDVALGIRRLHDINRTGWWILLWFVIVVGWIVLFVWSIEKGDKGTNKYGPDPREATSQ